MSQVLFPAKRKSIWAESIDPGKFERSDGGLIGNAAGTARLKSQTCKRFPKLATQRPDGSIATLTPGVDRSKDGFANGSLAARSQILRESPIVASQRPFSLNAASRIV